MATTGPPQLWSDRRTLFGGNISEDEMVLLSHISLPVMTSGLSVSIRCSRLAFLLFILWKFMMLIFTGFLVCLFLWSTLFSFLLGHEQAFGDGTKLSVKSLLESVDRLRRVSNWVWCVSSVESRKAETLGSAQSRQCHEESLSLKKNLLSHAQAFTVIPAVTGVTCNTVWSHSFVTLTTRTFDVWPRVLLYFSGHYQEKADKYKGFLLMNFFL